MWVAKAMNSLLLPHLKKFSVTRHALKDYKKYYLINAHHHEPKIIYSADLSKSTDPMSVKLVHHIFQAVQRAVTGLPTWFKSGVEHVLGEQELIHEGQSYVTKCGALMGVGPGWTALCLLNAFCAHKAGAPEDSFKVCGDDLTALWPEDVCDRYEANLRTFGLVPNVSKSFRSSEAGVFCERIVGRLREHAAVVLPLIRLGEASGFRSYGGDKGRLSHDRLCKVSAVRPIRWLVHSTLKSLSLGPKTRGLYKDAGGGSLPPDVLNVVSYFLEGGINLTSSGENKMLRQAMEVIREIPLAESGVALESVECFARKHFHDWQRRRLHRPLQKPDIKAFQKVIKNHDGRRQRARNALSKAGGLHALLKERLESGKCYVRPDHPNAKKYVNQIIRQMRHKRSYGALRSLHHWHSSTMIDREVAELTIQETLPQYELPVRVNLQPAPRVWDSNRGP
jgi:hypothetical protein